MCSQGTTRNIFLTGSLAVEEVVHLVEAEEDLSGVADEKDDDDADQHQRDAAVPTTPARENAYSCHDGTYDPLLCTALKALKAQIPQLGRESSEASHILH